MIIDEATTIKVFFGERFLQARFTLKNIRLWE